MFPLSGLDCVIRLNLGTLSTRLSYSCWLKKKKKNFSIRTPVPFAYDVTVLFLHQSVILNNIL